MTLNRVTLPELLVPPILEEQLVALPLVVSFGMIMSAVLGQDTPKRPLAEQDHFRQAFLFDRADPSFRERVKIRTLGRQWDRFHAAAGQRFPERGTKLGVAIVQNIMAAMEVAPRLLRRAAANLLHPFLIWMSRDPGHAHAAAFQMQEEQHIVGRQPSPSEYLDCEEITTRRVHSVSGEKVLPYRACRRPQIVVQRTSEIGVRIALRAARGDVVLDGTPAQPCGCLRRDCHRCSCGAVRRPSN